MSTQIWVEEWLSVLLISNCSAHTLSAYRKALNQLERYLSVRNVNWKQLDKRSLSNYIAQRLEVDCLSTKSVHQELSAIRGFYKWLVEQGRVMINPTTGYQIKHGNRKLPTIADIDLLIQLLDQPIPEQPKQQRLWQRDKAMFELLYGSGLRVSELISIDINDIDNQNKQVRVMGKGSKTRIVPISNQALFAINQYLFIRYEWTQKHPDKPTMALFLSENFGSRLTTRSVQKRLKLWAKRAGIAQNMYPHLLRHCFASHLLSDSGDLRGIQEMLGHANIATTQIYTHVDFAQLTQIYDQNHPRAVKK